jgi:hypothetical protein
MQKPEPSLGRFFLETYNQRPLAFSLKDLVAILLVCDLLHDLTVPGSPLRCDDGLQVGIRSRFVTAQMPPCLLLESFASLVGLIRIHLLRLVHALLMTRGLLVRSSGIFQISVATAARVASRFLELEAVLSSRKTFGC